jgi:predicted AAA+ superfamily ATPase
MEPVEYITRRLENEITEHLGRGKSVLLLGPRQTGKTTLLGRLRADLSLSLVVPAVRQRYERDPQQLLREVEGLRPADGRRPLVVLDEVQKVPALLDAVQHAIDGHLAQFVLCGSSARQLRRRGAVNLLPGRVVSLRLDPLDLEELHAPQLEELLLYGSLPGIWTEERRADRERDLRSYVEAYLEEEIRAEAAVRNVGSFGRFLELAGLESGNLVSFRALSQDLGVSHTTVAGYYEILVDCLVAERVEPITRSRTRKKLTRASRHILFDLGVRRICANEGTRLGRSRLGQLFEQFVGLELIRLTRKKAGARVLFWRDPDGPEVDWVVEHEGRYTPIEVKWTDTPQPRDVRHVESFLSEYEEADRGFLVCRTPRASRVSERVRAIPWQELPSVASVDAHNRPVVDT